MLRPGKRKRQCLHPFIQPSIVNRVRRAGELLPIFLLSEYTQLQQENFIKSQSMLGSLEQILAVGEMYLPKGFIQPDQVALVEDGIR